MTCQHYTSLPCTDRCAAEPTANEYTIRARDVDGLYLVELDGAVVKLASRAAVGRLLMSQGYRRDVALSILEDLSTDSGVSAVTFRALSII